MTHPPVAVLPLAHVATSGYTTFLADDRDELGFDRFFASGLALEADLSRKEWFLKKTAPRRQHHLRRRRDRLEFDFQLPLLTLAAEQQPA